MATELDAGTAQHAGSLTPAPAAAAPRRRRAPAPRTVLAVASLGVFMAFVDATIVNVAFPDIERSFPGASIAGLSWVLSAYNIVFAAFLVAAGRLADLLGRRRVFLLGVVLFTVASGLCAVAPSPGALIGLRVLQALGAALIVPSSLALVLDAFPPERGAHAVALLTAVGAVGAGIGPSAGGLLVTVADWRLVFLVNVPLGIVAYVLSRRHLVESRTPGRRQVPDLLGALVFALAVSALVLAVTQGQEWGWTSPAVLGAFAASVVLLGVFVRRSARHRSPVIDLRLLRNRTFSVANGMSVVASAGFFGYTLSNILFLTGVWGYTVLEAGLAVTPGPFVAAAVAGGGSRLAERHGHRAVLVAGGLVWGAAVLWLILRVGTTPAFLAEWLPASVLLGVGAGLMFPNLSGAAIASAPGEDFATATGLNAVARQVGAALGVAVVVAIIGTPSAAEAPGAFDDAWIFAACCLAGAGLGCLLVGRVRAAAPSLAGAARAVLAPPRTAAPAAAERRRAPARTVLPADGVPDGPESPAQFLARVPILAGLPAQALEDLAARAQAVEVPAGGWLFREGEAGDALFVVRSGRMEVVDEAGGVLRVLGRGAALGELALLTSSPRSASVRAARDSELIAIAHGDFQELLRSSPPTALALTRVLGEQLRDSRPAAPDARPRPVTIALVPLDAGAPVAALAARLEEALGRHARVARLDGTEVIGPDSGGSAAAAYGPLLDRAEGRCDHVLLVCGSVEDPDPWTAFALAGADRVLAVGRGGPPPPEAERRAELRGSDLVAVDVAMGSGALAAWAALLAPSAVHPLRTGDGFGEDVERIARRLAGRSLGIVLSGGGARAFSHVGVLEELHAAGLMIDRVAGVSMGAYVGGMYAMGMDADEMDAHCYDEWVRRRPLSDYTVPRHALIRGDRFVEMMQRVFGTVAIEELPRGFFCGSADLRSGELVVSRTGAMWDAVAVSMCVPILAPPQVRDGRLLIDGSLVDNLPVATMAAAGEGPIIAVDVKASFGPPGGARAGGAAPAAANGAAPAAANGAAPASANAGAPAPLSREPRALRVPALGETVTRILLLGSANTSEAARRHADVVITPRTDGVGLFEFHQLDRAREAGRAAARAALEDGSLPRV